MPYRRRDFARQLWQKNSSKWGNVLQQSRQHASVAIALAASSLLVLLPTSASQAQQDETKPPSQAASQTSPPASTSSDAVVKPSTSSVSATNAGTEKSRVKPITSPEAKTETSQTAAPVSASETTQSTPAEQPAASGDSQPSPLKAESQPQPPVTAVATSKVATEPKPPADRKLIVSSWAGAYGAAQKKAIISPLSRDLGIEIERRSPKTDTDRFDTTDVTELDQSSLLKACKAGRIVKLGPLTADDNDQSDFFAKPMSDCGIPTFAWSSIVIADGEGMKKLARRRYRTPSKLSHILNTKRYPGKRALIRSPKRLLEMMVLAGGTEPDEVYAKLATRQGQDEAFKTLDQLSKHVLWVDGPREALQALDQGQVTMAMTYSGRAFRRLISGHLLPIWDGHIIDYASWAVSAKSRNVKKAKRFIVAATSAESLAAQARLWPYGPMRRSALPLAQRHDLLDTQLDSYMPTSNMRFGQGLILDATFWADQGAALKKRFTDWQSGVPLGIRVPIPTKAPPAPLPPPPNRLQR
jgi:putative spermidine/putrescine transport system substrate-binding protein